MLYKDIVSQLCSTIKQQLNCMISNDYIYIDLPFHANIGDTLIWKGTEQFLASLPYRCLLRASYQTYTFPALSSNTVILLHGGGNIGDLYVHHNEFRKNVIMRYPHNKIIIFPHTVYYDGARNARTDAIVYRKHKKLTICARDKYSYRFLKAFGFCNDIRLVPDMAFCINVEELKQYVKPPLSNRDLLFKRIDKEKKDTHVVDRISKDYDICDWPLYGEDDPALSFLYDLIKNKKWKEADDYAVNTYLPNRVRVGVELISQYNRVISNRLHASILSILLGKEVFILDNSYGKNSQYYNTWLKGMNNVTLLSSSKSNNLYRKIKFSVCCLLSIKDRIFRD